MKNIFCYIVIGVLMVSCGGFNTAASAQARPKNLNQNQEQEHPPKKGQQDPECKPAKDHPCPPHANSGEKPTPQR